MEFLNGVIPARMIKEVIADYNGYKIVADINKMVLLYEVTLRLAE